jgi:hypothetical protein
MRFPLAGMISVFVLLGGCAGIGTKTPGTGDLAVWSDDGAEVALVADTGDGPRIFVQTPGNSERRPIGQARPHPVAGLYYMRQAGYLVVESHPPGGGAKFDRLWLNGEEAPIIETLGADLCEGVSRQARPTVIPSPDGQVLAQVYSQSCGTATVDFLNPRDLLATDGYSVEIGAPVWATWHPGGYLLLAEEGTGKAWRISPNNPPQAAAYPRCGYPATTSSALSSDGRQVSLQGDSLVVENMGAASTRAFGCQ